MTELPTAPQDGPRELLSATRQVVRQVRQAQRGTWFPLLVFAGLTLASIPVTSSSHHPIACRVRPIGRICIAFSPAAAIFWPVALVLAYIVIAAFYLRRTRRRGVGTRVRPYVVAGIAIAILATAASLLLAFHPGLVGFPASPSSGPELLFRLLSPESAIGLALLVLAWVGHSRALVVFGLLYLVIVGFGWMLAPPSRLVLPVAAAAVLLLGAAGFALAERPGGRLAE